MRVRQGDKGGAGGRELGVCLQDQDKGQRNDVILV